MLKTSQLTAGVLGGLWGVGVSLLWWVLYFTSDQLGGEPQILAFSGVMGGFSLAALGATLQGTGEPTPRGLVLLWVGATLLLLATALTIASLGLLYVPAILLLFIAAILATARHPGRPGEVSRWVELVMGGGGASLGVVIAALRLTTRAYSQDPQTSLAIEEASKVLLWEANPGVALFVLLLGVLSLVATAGFALHTWRGPRRALATVWVSAGGLLLVSAAGISMGSLSYLPTVLLVLLGSFVATFRDAQGV